MAATNRSGSETLYKMLQHLHFSLRASFQIFSFNHHQSPAFQTPLSICHSISPCRISMRNDLSIQSKSHPGYFGLLLNYEQAAGITEIDRCLARVQCRSKHFERISTMCFPIKLFSVELSTHFYLPQHLTYGAVQVIFNQSLLVRIFPM